MGAGCCCCLRDNAMLIQDRVVTIVGSTSYSRGTLSWKENEEVTWSVVCNLRTDAHVHTGSLTVLYGFENIIYGGGKNGCSEQWDNRIVWLCRECDRWRIGRWKCSHSGRELQYETKR